MNAIRIDLICSKIKKKSFFSRNTTISHSRVALISRFIGNHYSLVDSKLHVWKCIQPHTHCRYNHTNAHIGFHDFFSHFHLHFSINVAITETIAITHSSLRFIARSFLLFFECLSFCHWINYFTPSLYLSPI